MSYKVGYEIPLSKLEDMKTECHKMITMCNQIIPKRRELIEYGGISDYEQQKINRKINPEDYYKFRIWDKGCEIVYTCYYFDENMQKFCKGKKYYYSIRYHNINTKLFLDKTLRNKMKYNTDNTSYGNFETLEEATKYFECAVVDILEQLGIFNNNLWNITETLKERIKNGM